MEYFYLEGLRQKKRLIKRPLEYGEEKYADDEIEKAFSITQAQLNNARLFNTRYQYAKTLKKNISYLEVGVGWGHSAETFIEATNAESADLLDLYNNARDVLEAGPQPRLDSETHEEYIKNKFAYHPNVNIIKGDAKDILPTINKKYDLIFLDIDSERFFIRNTLLLCSKLINDGGVIGLSSYTNYNIRYNHQSGVYQSVNEFLRSNENWSVDGIVLEEVAIHDIFIKKNW